MTLTKTKITTITKKRYYDKIISDMLEYNYKWEDNVLYIFYPDCDSDINGIDRADLESYIKKNLLKTPAIS